MVLDHAHPARGLIAESVSLRDFRSYEQLDLALQPGIVLVVGPNGSGKTNLLESLHVATQGFSPRTRADAQLIRFGCDRARIAIKGRRNGVELTSEVELHRHDRKRAALNGAPLRSAEQLRQELSTLVFTPDRLAVVKGAPAVRRAYTDRVLARLFPARAALPTHYGEALGQRNAALRRIALGLGSRDALEPWTAQVLALGLELQEARRELLEQLSPRFAECAAELALESCLLSYEARVFDADTLEHRLDRDLARGVTGAGPHLDDIAMLAGSRDLRSFGSQGEQRLAVLSLLLAEAEMLIEQRGACPLVLLDDVLSELDASRRSALTRRLTGLTQTLLTATSEQALPFRPDQIVHVRPGYAGAVVGVP
ncbi:MAG: DNA replication/repair protein RecF [Gaiellaceae bacterium]